MSELCLSAVNGSACGLASSLLFVAKTASAVDPATFGKAVRYLDGALSPTIVHRAGHTPCLVGEIRSLIADEQLSLGFFDANRIRLDLLAGSANTLVCFSLTPYVSYYIANPTPHPVSTTLVFQTEVTIDSAVLVDPTLIDTSTGRPFGGSLKFERLTAHYASKTLPGHSSEQQTVRYSQESISGSISIKTLQTTYGLSRLVAQTVLRSALTVRFATAITLSNVPFAISQLDVRLFGD